MALHLYLLVDDCFSLCRFPMPILEYTKSDPFWIDIHNVQYIVQCIYCIHGVEKHLARETRIELYFKRYIFLLKQNVQTTYKCTLHR